MSISWLLTNTRLKEELENQQAQHLRLIENIPEVVWRAAEAGDAVFISARITSVFGYTPEEILREGAKLWFGRMHPDDREHVRRDYAELFRTGKKFDVQYRIQHREGHWMWWHDRAVLVEDTSTSTRYADGILSDVTEMKRLEEQLQQSQKLEAVGRLAGGVAHDFNNLVQVISGYVELLEKRVEEDPKAQEYASKIKAAAFRAGGLTQQLLAFSRKQLQHMRVLDINETVSQVCSILDRVLGENVDILLRLAPQPAAIKGDETQVEQILMNLAVNARDAMPNGGKLIIETGHVVVDDACAKQAAGLAPGEYVMLVVSDTGTGMAADTLSHAFEPFFTTKEPGKGTGLGLAMVYGIVKQSGGHVSVYSEVGKGSSFRIYLPACHQVANERPAIANPHATGGGETILLVEDETPVRDLARVLLEKLGYHVIAASNAKAALELATSFSDSLHLLLTDVVMPGSSGRQLAEKLSVTLPNMKVLYMTGYTDDALLHHQLLESSVSILRKPFTREHLAIAVRNTLDGLSYQQTDCNGGDLVCSAAE
jgi:two-component system cell cycle sensor histidine kinase/response regulator CckA